VAERKGLPSAEELQRATREKARQKAKESISARPTNETLINFWKRTLSDYGISSMSLSFTGKERGMIRNLVRQFTETSNGKAGFHLASFLEFAIAHWQELRKKIVWDNNPKRSKLHEIPNISEVYFNREDILHYMTSKPEEVQTAKDREEVFTDLKKVPIDHPQYKEIALAIKHTGRAILH
jgi:hypothetical protein